MNFHAIGDLAQSLTSRRHSATLQSDLARLTQELSSGQPSDVGRHLNGNFGQLSDIENQIVLNSARKTSGAEAATLASTMQNALEHIHTQMTDLSNVALLVGGTSDSLGLNAAATHADNALETIVSALNTELAGRPIFAGTALDKMPLINSEALMDASRTIVAGLTDASSIIAALSVFFHAPGGGFEADIYQGGSENLSPYRLGGGESVQLSIRADDPALRAVLADTVMAALAGDDSLLLTDEERLALLQAAAGSMRMQLDGVTNLRSDLGFAQERIAQSTSRNAAERTSLNMARGELLSIDVFEAASALEEVQIQLETIYMITARTSRLSLVNFL